MRDAAGPIFWLQLPISRLGSFRFEGQFSPWPAKQPIDLFPDHRAAPSTVEASASDRRAPFRTSSIFRVLYLGQIIFQLLAVSGLRDQLELAGRILDAGELAESRRAILAVGILKECVDP